MQIRLGRKQSFWRPIDQKNGTDMSFYLSPNRPYMDIEWEKLPEYVKEQIKSSKTLGLIEVVGEIPTEKKEEQL